MERGPSAGKHIITRGNLDGIACAAVFLDRFPEAKVTFVTSPPAALRVLERDETSEVWIADIALTGEIAAEMRSSSRTIILVDHHPTSEEAPGAFVDTGPSAAGLLHRLLGRSAMTRRLAALADLTESSGTSLLKEVSQDHSAERLEREAAVLDFSWRKAVEDDDFRLAAARSLSRGSWPSEVPAILERYRSVRSGDGWTRALEKIRREMVVLGPVGVLDTRGRRTSFKGFGSKAMIEVARERGCRCAVLLQDGGETTTVSLRATDREGIDVGAFVEGFARARGLDGGGHRASAGARLPTKYAADLVSELMRAAA